jgi:hypothetical protein
MKKKNAVKALTLTLVAAGLLSAKEATAATSSLSGWPVLCPVCFDPAAAPSENR